MKCIILVGNLFLVGENWMVRVDDIQQVGPYNDYSFLLNTKHRHGIFVDHSLEELLSTLKECPEE